MLVNNGRYVGPGHMDQVLDTPVELLDRHLEANVMAPVILTKLVLPGMVERGGGVVINLASSSGTMDPPAPAGEGGWGLGYGMSKGALHRIAGILAVELGSRGILAFNLSPGFVATERIAQDMAGFGFDASRGAPPDVVGAVAAWLVTSPEAHRAQRGRGSRPRRSAATSACSPGGRRSVATRPVGDTRRPPLTGWHHGLRVPGPDHRRARRAASTGCRTGDGGGTTTSAGPCTS